MGRFTEGCERRQTLLLANRVDDYVGEENPVRVIGGFVDELDLAALGFEGAAATGRSSCHPATLLKLYLYGYLKQVQSSRRLERETGRNVEVMWLTGKRAPDCRRTTRSDRIISRPVRRNGPDLPPDHGHDRVMIQKFVENDAGVIVGEARRARPPSGVDTGAPYLPQRRGGPHERIMPLRGDDDPSVRYKIARDAARPA